MIINIYEIASVKKITARTLLQWNLMVRNKLTEFPVILIY